MIPADRVLREVESARDEMVDFAAELIRIRTVNPPGVHYRECAERIGRRLADFGYEVDYLTAQESKEHTEEHPRINVVGIRPGHRPRPLVHLNGHFDVVPTGVARIAGVESCVAYGPGELEQAHQPDEWCGVEDMVDSAKVMALTLIELLG